MHASRRSPVLVTVHHDTLQCHGRCRRSSSGSSPEKQWLHKFHCDATIPLNTCSPAQKTQTNTLPNSSEETEPEQRSCTWATPLPTVVWAPSRRGPVATSTTPTQNASLGKASNARMFAFAAHNEIGTTAHINAAWATLLRARAAASASPNSTLAFFSTRVRTLAQQDLVSKLSMSQRKRRL